MNLYISIVDERQIAEMEQYVIDVRMPLSNRDNSQRKRKGIRVKFLG